MTLAIEKTEGYLKCGIFYRHWPAQGPVRSVVLLVHGLGEHSGRYAAFAEYFNARGIAVVAPDHLGHGKSPGDRAHITSFDQYLSPLDELRDNIDTCYPELPCFLVGHSMGGLIAALYLVDRQARFAGAALSAAALQPAEPPSIFVLWLSRFFSRAWPTLGMLQLDATQVSRDPQVVQDYIDDPLVYNGKGSARLVAELFRNMELAQAEANKITLPIIIMHGEADVMTSSQGSVEFHQLVGSESKSLKLYPELFHEIFNEPERLAVLSDLGDWLDSRTATL